MEDYREIGPPGNGKTRKTGASNLAAVRETTRPVRIHASRVIFRGALIFVPFGHYDEPEILRYAITSIRPKGADVRHKVLRELGRHPGDGAPVRLKTGHYGPFVAHRRRYASLPKDPRPGGRDPGRRRGAAGTPVSSSAKDASSARCGDRKARSGAPAAAGRAGHGSMRVRAPARAVASSRGRARRRESAGDPVARACRAAPDGARPATPNGRPGSRAGRPVARQSERYGCPDRGPTAGSGVRTSAVALLRSLTMRLTFRA